MAVMDVYKLQDEKAWRKTLHTISDKLGLAMSLTDAAGKILLSEGSRNPLCAKVRENTDTLVAFCSSTNAAMTAQIKAGKKAVADYCEGGLIRVAVPLMLENELIGQVTGCGLAGDPEEIDAFYLARELQLEESLVNELLTDIGRNPEYSVEALKDLVLSQLESVCKSESGQIKAVG